MSAFHARQRHARRAVALALGLGLVIPLGCGGTQVSTGDAGKTNPKAAERQRDMENFMKNQKAK
jgi:hypothetical protein